ncbi:MAG: aldose 1-epimerase family protein [Salinibacterium sp.]|nr:aldose 1-epimerase family protein [Salinibacterium sp.]
MNQPTTEPTGTQHVLTRGDARAVITEVAASVREYSVGGVDIVQPYPELSSPPFASGIILMPWPNRVADGRWNLGGVTQQLDITEPAKNNAIHGLLRYTGYRVDDRTDESITLAATVFPQHGYPFHLETTVRYELVDGGLAVTHGVRNLSSDTAPVGIGAHPFLTIGDVPTEDLVLTVHASTYFDVDARLLPHGELSVVGTRYDLRNGVRVGDLELDTAFGGVSTRDGVVAVLQAPDGREVRLVQDDAHPYVQVFTTRTYPKKDGAGLAVAIEPMTAAPDALNSGLGLHWVEPGATWNAGWGIQYSG